ncbi:Plexin-B2 [Merluccius polli]|uniref:Plexin-B2 n=1 Tax=Merluccius polli TaxID=89951 RepID=A0AA47P509_MERPO|nr:Plexin-B2 [Merluccius polli]
MQTAASGKRERGPRVASRYEPHGDACGEWSRYVAGGPGSGVRTDGDVYEVQTVGVGVNTAGVRDLMIEMEDHTNDLSEGRIPLLDYKTYVDRVFFLPSKDGANDVMITGKLDIPEARRPVVTHALNQFANLLNSKPFLINTRGYITAARRLQKGYRSCRRRRRSAVQSERGESVESLGELRYGRNTIPNRIKTSGGFVMFIHTLEGRPEFNARAKVYFASLLTVALHGQLEYYTDIMKTLLLDLMESYVHSKNPKLMLRRSETVVERMLCNWMSICLYQFLKDSAGEPLYKLFRAIKHQIEKGPVDARLKKAKYTLNDTRLLGDDVEYCVLVLVQGEGLDVTPVKVLNCDTISQVKEKIIEQVYRNLPYSQRPKVDSVTLGERPMRRRRRLRRRRIEWRPGSTGQILSDLDLTSQKEGRWKCINTLAHYNVRDNATVVLARVMHAQYNYDQNQENQEERNALLEDDKVFHLVRPTDELDEIKSKRGSIKDKSMTKAITEIYLTRLLSVKGTLQQFVDDFFRSVLCSGTVVPPVVKYFFDFLDEQALKHDNVDEETIHIWKTNRHGQDDLLQFKPSIKMGKKVYPSSDGYFQQDNAPCHKAQIISDWFLEHDNEFTVLKWPPQSPDLNPIEHLWDVVEREIRIMDVQPTNLQQLRDAIMSIWTKLSEECFQYLVESVPRRIKAVLKAKGGPTRLPLRFWVNILKNPHFIFDVHVTEMVDSSLSVIAQTFMDACTKSEHKLSRDSPSNKLLYAKEISTYKKMVDDYYKGIRQMVSVSDQDMNTHLAEVSRSHTDKLNTQVALYQLYQYASKYYDVIIASLEDDPATQSKQLTLRLQQIAAALENKVTDL